VVLAVGFTLMKAWVAGEPAISEARGDERSAIE
jgi:hypothetical protein